MFYYHFLILVISFFGLAIIGEQIHRNAYETGFSGFSRSFVNLFSGLFFVVTGFAVVKTLGQTINLLIFSLFIGAIVRHRFYLKKAFSFNFKLDTATILSGIPLLIFFGWRLYTLDQADSDLHMVVNMDSMKHVIRANFLNEFGIESINVNYLHPPSGVDPYHYFEAWSVALFGALFESNFWIAEQLVVYPLFSSIVVVGFWGIISRFNAPPLAFVLGILAPQFSGFYLEHFESFKYLSFSGGFRTNAFDEWKGFCVSIAYFVVLLFLNLLIRFKTPVKALMVLMILPLVSISLLPATFSASILCLIVLFLFRKKLNLEVSVWNWIVPIGVFAYIVLFYQIFESEEVIIEKPGLVDNLMILLDVSRLKLAVVLAVEKLMQGSILFLPILGLAIFSFSRNRTGLKKVIEQPFVPVWVVIILCIVFCGAFIWQVFYEFFGSSQFLFYSSMPLVNISVLTLLVFVCMPMKSQRARIMYVVGITGLFFFFWSRSYEIYLDSKHRLNDKYSLSFVEKSLSFIGDQPNVNGFKIVDEDDIVKWDENDHLVGGFLVGYYKQVNMYNLNYAHAYWYSNIEDTQAKMMLPFSGIVSHSRSIKGIPKLEETVMDLIENHSFKWVFVAKDQPIPSYLKGKLKLLATDDKSGEQLYRIGED